MQKQPIYLHNTLGKATEEFTPLKDGEVSLYSCGPTVYNDAHIGNLRAYVFVDILKRTLIANGYSVKHVMNITDIGHLTSDADEGDDKMVKALKREGKEMTLESLHEVGSMYFERFKDDLSKLNVLLPDSFPFASEHIKEDIDLINVLFEKDVAYKTPDGIYFDTSKLPSYGRLGGISKDMISRIGENSSKKNPEDFALWKFADDGGIGFDAPFGKGFPGWHIECSAMSMKYLGETFDIHTGGIDHIPVHHNNEIAQSEAATGKLLARYWMHNGHITIGEDRMAKSGGNFLTLSYLSQEGIEPLDYRYFLLLARYSTRLDYSLDAVKAAKAARRKLVEAMRSFEDGGKVSEKHKEEFLKFVNNDLDTPKAIALLWDLLKDSSLSPADKKATILAFDAVLGLDLENIQTEEISLTPETKELLGRREKAREEKNWAEADRLRDELLSHGLVVKDTSTGQSVDRV